MNKIQKFKSFWFNGEKYLSSNHKLSIYDLINYFNYNPSLLVVEYNKFIVYQYVKFIVYWYTKYSWTEELWHKVSYKSAVSCEQQWKGEEEMSALIM